MMAKRMHGLSLALTTFTKPNVRDDIVHRLFLSDSFLCVVLKWLGPDLLVCVLEVSAHERSS